MFSKVNLFDPMSLTDSCRLAKAFFPFFFSAALQLTVSDTFLDTKGLKFLFTLSPMKLLGKCVWNQL